MGYTTSYSGVLHFTRELYVFEILLLQAVPGTHVAEHPQLEVYGSRVTYLDFGLNKEANGLCHRGTEKSNYGDEQINTIMHMLRAACDYRGLHPTGLQGSILCQGEDIGDVYRLVANGEAPNMYDTSFAFVHVQGIDTHADNGHVICPKCSTKFPMAGNEERDNA